MTTDIAEMASDFVTFHGDPTDRLIAATATYHRAKLVTADKKRARGS